MRRHSIQRMSPSRIDCITIPGQLPPEVSRRRAVSEERASDYQRRCSKLRYNRIRASTKRERASHLTAGIQAIRKENEERNKHLARIEEGLSSMNRELEQQRVLVLNLQAQNSFLKRELFKITGGGIPDDQRDEQTRFRCLSLEDDEPLQRDSEREMELCGEEEDVGNDE